MNPVEAPALPHVRLSRPQWLRMVVVGILVVLALARVIPDLVRVIYPLSYFGYTTNGDAVVATVGVAVPSPKPGTTAEPAAGPALKMSRKGGSAAPAARSTDPVDPIALGDRVRIDRVKPFDRKPGLVGGRTYTYDNPDRRLPIERAGRERILHLEGRHESVQVRLTDVLRVLLCIVGVGLGAMLFLVKPSIATAAYFVFCLGAVDPPTTYLDTILPMPWRQYPEWIYDTIRGFVRPALLLFALCLIDGDSDFKRERVFAGFAGAIGIVLGTLNAYAQWSLTYGARPAEHIDRIVRDVQVGLSALTVAALAIAFVRAPGNDRHRISWIAGAFVFAGIARTISEALFPGHIQFFANSLLVSATIVPIVTIWIAVVRHRFFNVDFVVSRAVVYVALTAALVGVITLIEEVGTYTFIMNTDIAYGVVILISIGIGLVSARITDVFYRIVDRFIFRNRYAQRQALDYIAGYILDAETAEDVYRALLFDAAHALDLSFGGILERRPDGGFALGAERNNWPEDFEFALAPDNELARTITANRGALTGNDTRAIQHSFPNERLTFAAPLFYGREVSAIVVYGHNVSGLDLDPEEREHLVRVVAHASIALNAIELARYRNAAAATPPDPLPMPAT